MRDIRWEYNIDIILTYVTTDDDQTNPTTKQNVIQHFFVILLSLYDLQ